MNCSPIASCSFSVCLFELPLTSSAQPTSGLSAADALSLVRLLRSLTYRGLAILISIHQPRLSAFELFDRVLLLNQGHLLYWGQPSAALSYFASLGVMVPRRENPADALLDAFESRDNLLLAQGRRSQLEELARAQGEEELRRLRPGLSGPCMSAATTSLSSAGVQSSSSSDEPLTAVFAQLHTGALLYMRLCVRDFDFLLVPFGSLSVMILLAVGLLWSTLRPPVATHLYTAGTLYYQISTASDMFYHTYGALYLSHWSRFGEEVSDGRMSRLMMALWYVWVLLSRNFLFNLVACLLSYWTLSVGDGSAIGFLQFYAAAWIMCSCLGSLTLSCTALTHNAQVGHGLGRLAASSCLLHFIALLFWHSPRKD
jgi:hypothetical protein